MISFRAIGLAKQLLQECTWFNHVSKESSEETIVVIAFASDLTLKLILDLQESFARAGQGFSIWPVQTPEDLQQFSQRFQDESLPATALYLNGLSHSPECHFVGEGDYTDDELLLQSWGVCLITAHGDHVHSKLTSFVLCAAPDDPSSPCNSSQCVAVGHTNRKKIDFRSLKADVYLLL
jgi:hypothetical protein